jgi:ribonuclease HI
VWEQYTCTGKIIGVVREESVPAGNLCTSYRAEMVAILKALSMVVERNLDEPGDPLLPRGGKLLLCTDSKSSIERLMVGPYRQKSGLEVEVWRCLLTISQTYEAGVWLQFVPSHCGLEKNELVDHEAVVARSRLKGDQDGVQVTLEMDKAKVRRECATRWRQLEMNMDSEKFRLCGGRRTQLSDNCRQWSREDQVLLARLRTGETYEMGRFMVRVGRRKTGVCR